MFKEVKYVFCVLIVFSILIGNSSGDRLLPNHANYFEIEAVDTSNDTTISKFFPFGWWYNGYRYNDTLCPQIDSMYTDTINPVIGDTNKYNVFMITAGEPDSVLLNHLEYGVSKGMYGFGTFPEFITGIMNFIDRFEGINPDYSRDYNESILCDWGWHEFCYSDSIDSTDYEILNAYDDTIFFGSDTVMLDSLVMNNCLHILSDDPNFCLTFKDPDTFATQWRGRFRYRLAGFELDWLSFKIASDSTFRDSSYTFRFIAKYLTHNENTSDTASIYVELNSKAREYIPVGEGYDSTTSTITVSLQNPDYFSDVEGDSFPLYDRNPEEIINLNESENWFIVFAMMDSIIYNFTDSVGDPYILDSLVSFKFVGTHYYLKDLEFRSNPQNMKPVDKRQAITQ